MIDDFVEMIKKEMPDFALNKEDKDVAVKAYVLFTKDEKLKEKYLKEIAEEDMKEKIVNVLATSKKRDEDLISILDMMLFEKEILERKIKVIKGFMN